MRRGWGAGVYRGIDTISLPQCVEPLGLLWFARRTPLVLEAAPSCGYVGLGVARREGIHPRKTKVAGLVMAISFGFLAFYNREHPLGGKRQACRLWGRETVRQLCWAESPEA